ncbi:hypothetical protein PQX77_019126 [Marasmius sp. AFHP31]|nr:hypothetical protein PQX77_019126 [Marasmius sp. AFHP31]
MPLQELDEDYCKFIEQVPTGILMEYWDKFFPQAVIEKFSSLFLTHDWVKIVELKQFYLNHHTVRTTPVRLEPPEDIQARLCTHFGVNFGMIMQGQFEVLPAMVSNLILDVGLPKTGKPILAHAPPDQAICTGIAACGYRSSELASALLSASFGFDSYWQQVQGWPPPWQQWPRQQQRKRSSQTHTTTIVEPGQPPS